MFVGWEAGSALPNSNMVSYLWVASLWLGSARLRLFLFLDTVVVRARANQTHNQTSSTELTPKNE